MEILWNANEIHTTSSIKALVLKVFNLKKKLPESKCDTKSLFVEAVKYSNSTGWTQRTSPEIKLFANGNVQKNI